MAAYRRREYGDEDRIPFPKAQHIQGYISKEESRGLDRGTGFLQGNRPPPAPEDKYQQQ